MHKKKDLRIKANILLYAAGVIVSSNIYANVNYLWEGKSSIGVTQLDDILLPTPIELAEDRILNLENYAPLPPIKEELANNARQKLEELDSNFTYNKPKQDLEKIKPKEIVFNAKPLMVSELNLQKQSRPKRKTLFTKANKRNTNSPLPYSLVLANKKSKELKAKQKEYLPKPNWENIKTAVMANAKAGKGVESLILGPSLQFATNSLQVAIKPMDIGLTQVVEEAKLPEIVTAGETINPLAVKEVVINTKADNKSVQLASHKEPLLEKVRSDEKIGITDPCYQALITNGTDNFCQDNYFDSQKGPDLIVLAENNFDKPIAITKHAITQKDYEVYCLLSHNCDADEVSVKKTKNNPSPKMTVSLNFSDIESAVDDYNRYCVISGRCPGIFAEQEVLKPAYDITYKQALAYAKWLSIQTGKNYRLPTFAEWQQAMNSGEENMCNLFQADRLNSANSFAENKLGISFSVTNKEWVAISKESMQSAALAELNLKAKHNCSDLIIPKRAEYKNEATTFRLVRDILPS